MKKVIFTSLVFIIFTNLFAQTIDPGTTTGQLDISLTGGATYSIPISVPPGIKDVVPQIGLAYSSQAGNGIAGWGWNITGLSSISRIPETIFHDGEIDGVDFNNKDRFALDGQRLILESGTYGSDGSIYVTENYSNIKVKAFGTHPSGSTYGPLFFNVYYPNGNIATYGYNNNSTSNMSWAISKWFDPQGNTINYFYNTSEPRLITSILYGSGNESSTGINGVYFNYENRNRIENLYVGGVNLIIDQRLNNIQVKCNSTLLRQYNLSYNTTELNYERLSSFQELNGEGHSLTPIYFEYGSSSTNIQSTTTIQELNFDDDDFDRMGILSGDFNMDGKVDLVVYEKGSSVLSLYDNENFSQKIDFDTNLSFNKKTIFTTNLLENNKLTPKQFISIVNFEKIENQEYIKFSNYSLNNDNLTLVNTNQFNIPSYTTDECDNVDEVVYPIPLNFYSGDFNGDGLTEYLAFAQGHFEEENCISTQVEDPQDPSGYNTFCNCESGISIEDKRVFLVNVKDNTFSQIGLYQEELDFSDVGGKIEVGDFNGDGKQDLIVFQEGKVIVYGLNASNQIERIYQLSVNDIFKKITVTNSIDKHFPIVTGDYNGDGLIDFMCPNTSITNNLQVLGDLITIPVNNIWRVFLSNGKSFNQFSQGQGNNSNPIYYQITTPQSNGDYYRYNIIATDINADGKSDIVWHKLEKEYSGNDDYEELRIFINQNTYTSGNAFSINQIYEYSDQDSQVSANGFPIFVNSNHGNYSNEYAYVGHHMIVNGDDKINIKRYFSTTNIKPNFLLNKVTNNTVETTVEYGTITPENTNYETSTNATYPYVNINFSPFTYMVKKVNENGGGIFKSQDYQYKGFVSHLSGLGFMGPIEQKRSSWFDPNNLTIPKIWVISQHDPLRRGAVTQQWTSLSKEDYATDFISRTDNFYTTTLSPTKVYLNIPYQINQTDALQGISTTTTQTYDVYNNMTQTLTTFTGGSKKTELEYINNPTQLWNVYHIGRPVRKIETNTIGTEIFSTEEQYEYSNNLVTQIKRKGVDTNWITETLEYDTYGNVKKKTLNANAIANRVENFTYDTSGIFLIKSYDIEGLMTQFNYNTTYGYLTSEINPYGLITSYQYDGWGRMTKSTDYLGNATNYSITILPNGGIQKTTDYPSGPDEVSQYNAFGWLMNSKVLRLNNKWVKSNINYDFLGRKIGVSEPYFETASPTQWTTSEFDNYGRIIKITEPTGKIITSTYSGLTTIVNDGVKTVTATKDIAGNVVSMNDPGGLVSYTYFANGTMKTANYAGHIVSTQIDGWGRKISLNDPDAGIYTYQYNDIGELLIETTPKGSTTYNYDDYGKTISKQIVGDLTNINTNYVYDPNTKLLNSISGTNTVNNTTNDKTQTIVYDSYKRVKEVYETSSSDAVSFSQKNTFDNLGRIGTSEQNTLFEGVSDQVKTQNLYDSSGNLTQIKDLNSSVILWKKDTENARGQMLQVTLGNGAKKIRTYDDYGFLTKINDVKLGSTRPPVTPTINILRQTYVFNSQRGLLNSRQNTNLSWNESFTYDSQERLTQISGSVNFTQTYDDRGRINNNSNVGTYNYIGNNYQLEDIDLNTTGSSYYQGQSLQNITFNAFKKPIEISGFGNGYTYFQYDPITLQRSAMFTGEDDDDDIASTEIIKYYASIIPVEITKERYTNKIKIVTFVGGDAYSAPMMHIKRTGSAPLNSFFYLHRDYLGSILAISDGNGNIVEQRQFGAWGKIDKFLNTNGISYFDYYNSLLDRGYTGHEHMFYSSLINMNGRLYDPNLGRFLSPDNFVQDPFSTQSFNRYGYVLNNPLIYTDESGEFLLAAIMFGAITNMFFQAASGNLNSIGDFFIAGAIGAASGAAGFGAGVWAAGGSTVLGFGAGATVGAASGLAAGFVGGAGNAWMNGASFGNGLLAGLQSGISGGITGGLIGGVAGGIKAHKMGLDFYKGLGKVTDEVKFNGLFKSEFSSVACNECGSVGENSIGIGSDGMFKNGESILDFKADLSGSDDLGQAFKAFKKAHLVKGSLMGDLFDYNTQNGWEKNGWKLTGGNNGKTYIKTFLDGQYRLVIRASGISNFKTAGLFRGSLGKLGADIYIGYLYTNSNEYAQPLAQWIFPNSSMYGKIPNSVFRGMISPW